MPLDKWPCVPDSFTSILPGNLPYFLQTGATHAIGRPVSIIDPRGQIRVDAINPFDGYQSFCQCLRGVCQNRQNGANWNNICTKCDLLVAKRLVRDRSQLLDTSMPIIKYRCYMGLEELATTISVGGLSVMVVSGQFMPPEGLNDIKTAISSLGVRPPKQSELSPAMWESICRFGLPDELWRDVVPSEEERHHLQLHAESLQTVENGFGTKLLREAQRIAEIAQSYYDMAKARVEAHIVQEVAVAASRAISHGAKNLWAGINETLDVLRRELNLEYVAFFSGATESETILTLKASAGSLPRIGEGSAFPHYNWRKAGIRAQDGHDTTAQLLDWDSVSLADHELLGKGFRGAPNPFSSCAGLIPVRLPNGPFGMMVLGPQSADENLANHEAFVVSACRDLSTRILTLHLSQILQADRSDWEKTSRLTGHRVRASIQSVSSQLKTIQAERKGEPGFTVQLRDLAERDLAVAFRDLEEISYAAESNVPDAIDVKIARRELVPIIEIVSAAVADQQDLADEHDIKIEVSEERLSRLPPVWVNRILMRFVFINLINNGLKYSYPRPEDRKRILRVQSPNEPFDPNEVRVEVVNFGLGVKEADRERIFEWGVRLSESIPTFREIYGRGIGLWEAKHIVEGHGGTIYVHSVHHSKGAVEDYNIRQCITVFTVSLPSGLRVDEPGG
jgi:signal transduction histidine kinase